MGAEDPRGPHHESAVSVRDMVLKHEDRIGSLEDWRSELRGAFALVKVAIGASILSAVTSILAIAQMMSGGR